ncbi:hypothetical protein [Bacillus sp. HMF5848]|nr:hypothetical protein [Bacillus sp. HMF5848]
MTKRNRGTKAGLQSSKSLNEFSSELTEKKNQKVEKTSPHKQ